MNQLRPWALWCCLIAVLLATGICAGSALVDVPAPLTDRVADLQAQAPPPGVSADDLQDLDAADFDPDAANPPGLGIPALLVANGLLLVVTALTTLPLVLGNRVIGSVQGVVSLIAGLIALIGGIVMAVYAFAALIAMVSMFLAAPFGTLAYLAVFGFFPTGTSATLLAVLLVLQVSAAALLVVAHQRFLDNKGLMVLFATAVLLTLVTAILHSVVPGFLVSITDAVAAIIAAIVGAIWGLALVIGGIVSVVKLIVASRGARAGRAVRTV